MTRRIPSSAHLESNASAMQQTTLLILGAGWTSTFLLPLLSSRQISHAATSTTGRDNTIKFRYEPDEKDTSYFSVLPNAKYVLITFPLTGAGQSRKVMEAYRETHPKVKDVGFLQLGSSGIWQIEGQELWVTRRSEHDLMKPRAVAEDELLALGGCVLNLSGLWGGERQPRKWVERVADSKEKVESKSSLHMVHGEDVARGIVAVIENWGPKTRAQRWLVTDGFVYDWWSLFAGWAESYEEEKASAEKKPSKQSVWVYELMKEKNVRALPRSMETLGRCYDSREFWETFGLTPLKARI